MIRGLLIFKSLNQPALGYIPSLQVSYHGVNAPIYEVVEVGGALLTPVLVTVADSTQVWAYTKSHSWMLVVGASLLGSDSCNIFVSAQPAGSQPQRAGTITFTSTACANRVITIIQDARAG